jgi:hypothetical protein
MEWIDVSVRRYTREGKPDIDLEFIDGVCNRVVIGDREYSLSNCRLYLTEKVRWNGCDDRRLRLQSFMRADTRVEEECREIFGSFGVTIGFNPRYEMRYGKYKGQTIEDVFRSDPHYVASRAAYVCKKNENTNLGFVTYDKRMLVLRSMIKSKDKIMGLASTGSKLSDSRWWSNLMESKTAYDEVEKVVPELKLMRHLLEEDYLESMVGGSRGEELLVCRECIFRGSCVICLNPRDSDFFTTHKRCNSKLPLVDVSD